MSKLYKITRNPDQLSVDIDDPSGHYYAEYIGIKDPDSSNPLKGDFGSAAEAQEALDSYKSQFNQEPEEYLKSYYGRIVHSKDLANAKQRESEILNHYWELRNTVIPSLIVVECSLELKVKPV